MRSKNILQFHNVSFHYDEKPIINELNASIQDKEFVSIIGPSGCGKSTLFRLITGLEEASTGQIELTETKSHPVGYMPQKDMLLPWRTIIENAAPAARVPRCTEERSTNKGKGTVTQIWFTRI